MFRFNHNHKMMQMNASVADACFCASCLLIMMGVASAVSIIFLIIAVLLRCVLFLVLCKLRRKGSMVATL